MPTRRATPAPPYSRARSRSPSRTTSGVDEHDHEGRVITCEFEDFFLVCCYTPNSQDGLKRLDYRMSWEDAFRAYLMELDRTKPVIMCGDLNVAHEEIDLKNPSTNHMNAGFTDQERGKMTELLAAGFTDSFRYLYPDRRDAYSWWSFRAAARERNVGWRIDYFICSDRLRGAHSGREDIPRDHGQRPLPRGAGAQVSGFSIGPVQLAGRAVLAPMAGVSDAAFRTLCLEQGAALVYTEMVSAKALCYNDRKTGALLYIPESMGRPVAAQIFGHEPESMAEGARRALEISRADIIDINMGCPVGKIVKGGDGSAIMRTPELAGEIVSAVARAVDVPVTVKIRKGWDAGSVNCVEVARICEQAGAAAVAVHGRTRVQMYSGRADWDAIREVVRAVSVPVIANGDVFSGEDAARILKYTGAAACMIGRGSFGDPWLFARANAAIEGREAPDEPHARGEARARRTARWRRPPREKGERLACVEARARIPNYLRGVPHSGEYRQELVHISSARGAARHTAPRRHEPEGPAPRGEYMRGE